MLFLFLTVFAFAYEVLVLPKLTCQPCEDELTKMVDQIDGLDIVAISLGIRTVCLDAVDDQAMTKLKKELAAKEYAITEETQRKDCNFVVQSPWHGAEGDFSVVSSGERFSMRKNKVKGKYTLFDFGATWCGPCHDYANTLKPILQNNDTLAVRAIELGGDQKTSFDHPVVFQYLGEAEGLPWLILYNPEGKKIYEGNDLEMVIGLIK